MLRSVVRPSWRWVGTSSRRFASENGKGKSWKEKVTSGDYTVLMIAAASIILPTIAAITIFLPNERFFDPGRAQTHRGDVRGTPWKADGSDIKEANK